VQICPVFGQVRGRVSVFGQELRCGRKYLIPAVAGIIARMSLIYGKEFAIDWSTVIALRWINEPPISKEQLSRRETIAKNVGRTPTPPPKKRSLRIYVDLPLGSSEKEFFSIPFAGTDADLLWAQAKNDKEAFKVIEETFAVRIASIRAIVSTGPKLPLKLIVASDDGRAKPLSLDAALISLLLARLRDVS